MARKKGAYAIAFAVLSGPLQHATPTVIGNHAAWCDEMGHMDSVDSVRWYRLASILRAVAQKRGN